MMRQLVPGLVPAALVAVTLPMLAGTASAQSTLAGNDPPLTARERSLLDRIRNLEAELAELHDLKARLAAIEAKIGGDNQHRAEASAGQSAVPPVSPPLQPPSRAAGGPPPPSPAPGQASVLTPNTSGNLLE